MHWILILCAACVYVVLMPAKTITLTLIALAILTYITEKTASVITGASFTTVEALRSVGMSFLFLGCYCLAILLGGAMQGHSGRFVGAGHHYGGMGMLALSAGFYLAYIAGFKVGLGINILTAAGVALVTSATSVLLLMIAIPYL